MLQAIILDFNGVIISDEQYHRESWRQFTRELGFDLSEQKLKENIFGRREREVFQFLFQKEPTEDEIEKLSQKRNKIVFELEGKLIPVTGVIEFVTEVKKNTNLRLGLATNSRRAYLTTVLTEFDIQDKFDTIVTAEDVTYGKPDPQIYLKTAQSLGVAPNTCLVFEDSQAGIRAAKSAGMKVIALATTHTSDAKLNEADKIVLDFTEVNIENTRKLFEENQ